MCPAPCPVLLSPKGTQSQGTQGTRGVLSTSPWKVAQCWFSYLLFLVFKAQEMQFSCVQTELFINPYQFLSIYLYHNTSCELQPTM